MTPTDKPQLALAAQPALTLASGRTVAATMQDGHELLTVAAPGGEVELRVTFGPRGPVLHFEQAAVQLHTDADLDLRCRSFNVEAAESISLRTAGDLRLRAGHDASLSAQAMELRGRRGEVLLQANDDLVLNGERVLLNCPTAEERQRQLAQVRSVQELMQATGHPPGSPVRLPPSDPVDEGS